MFEYPKIATDQLRGSPSQLINRLECVHNFSSLKATQCREDAAVAIFQKQRPEEGAKRKESGAQASAAARGSHLSSPDYQQRGNVAQPSDCEQPTTGDPDPTRSVDISHECTVMKMITRKNMCCSLLGNFPEDRCRDFVRITDRSDTSESQGCDLLNTDERCTLIGSKCWHAYQGPVKDQEHHCLRLQSANCGFSVQLSSSAKAARPHRRWEHSRHSQKMICN